MTAKLLDGLKVAKQIKEGGDSAGGLPGRAAGRTQAMSEASWVG